MIAIRFVLALLALAFAAAAQAETRAAAPIAVTPIVDRVVVDGAVVRLGDLFHNLAANADQPVAPAPAPGGQIVFDFQRLVAVARGAGITWQPRSWTDRVVVERASQIVGQAEIEAAVRDALVRRGLPRKSDIEIAGRNLQLHLPLGAPTAVEVAALDYDERSGRFSATIAAPAGRADATRLTVVGRAYAMVELPVPTRRINAGETVRREDVEWIAVRGENAGRNLVAEATQLVGREARRALAAGQPVRLADLRAPIAVTKGSIVTMTLHTSRMQLSSKGRALEEGSVGDTVRIMNTQSKTVVEAVVTSVNTVQVTSAAAMN